MPSSGLHSNGYTLARALARGRLDERPPQLGGLSAGDALLAPTVIYVRAVLALLGAGGAVAGLAHITGDGLLNLRRLNDAVGFEIDSPLPVPGVCAWLCELGAIDAAQAHRVFNMGCGFVVVAPASEAGDACALLAGHHPGSAPIGRVTDRPGVVALPGLGVTL
jgi:phosphoribosylformylglycinamidine cyclo-ligase